MSVAANHKNGTEQNENEKKAEPRGKRKGRGKKGDTEADVKARKTSEPTENGVHDVTASTGIVWISETRLKRVSTLKI